MPIVTFSLPKQLYEKLLNQALEGESENLVAKRLILSIIEDNGAKTDKLNSLQERLEAVEDALEAFTECFNSHRESNSRSFAALKDMIVDLSQSEESKNNNDEDLSFLH